MARKAVLKERMVKELSLGRMRPSLTGADPVDEVERVLAIRRPLYQQASDLTVDTTDHDPQQVAQIIMEELWQRLKGDDREIQ